MISDGTNLFWAIYNGSYLPWTIFLWIISYGPKLKPKCQITWFSVRPSSLLNSTLLPTVRYLFLANSFSRLRTWSWENAVRGRFLWIFINSSFPRKKFKFRFGFGYPKLVWVHGCPWKCRKIILRFKKWVKCQKFFVGEENVS